MKKKIIVSIISWIAGTAFGMYIMNRVSMKKVAKEKERGDKHFDLYMLMNEWVRVKQDGKKLVDYMHKKGYHTIAIYGMNYVGETLVNEFKDTDLKIKYAIDERADNMFSEITLKKPDDELEEVDVIIVTPIRYFSKIAEKIEQKVSCPILSIEDLLYEV